MFIDSYGITNTNLLNLIICIIKHNFIYLFIFKQLIIKKKLIKYWKSLVYFSMSIHYNIFYIVWVH